MIVSEKEAKAKWCPQTMAPVSAGDRIWHEPVNCIGSACMAWRWEKFEVPLEVADISDTHGWCGKAGKP